MFIKENISKVMTFLYQTKNCLSCGVRIRFGDIDCPHCGDELEDLYIEWATKLLRSLNCEERN